MAPTDRPLHHPRPGIYNAVLRSDRFGTGHRLGIQNAPAGGPLQITDHIDVTHTVTLQTTHILPPAGTQNALDESHKKAATQQAARSITLLARCRRAHGARLGRWRSQKHRQWPSAGVSGGGRDLTLRADDPTSRGTTQPNHTPTQHETTQLKARFSSWALSLYCERGVKFFFFC